MALTGDFKGLDDLMRKVDGADKLLGKVTRAAKAEAGDQYRGDFAGKHDPWGESWASSPHGMVETGALAGAQVTSSPGVLRIRPPRYWVFHQVGANNMAKRAVLPFSESKWDPPIEAKIDAEVLEHFGKK